MPQGKGSLREDPLAHLQGGLTPEQLQIRLARLLAVNPGKSGSPASPERVQKLVATWEDLHGQAATAAIRSQIADYVRTA